MIRCLKNGWFIEIHSTFFTKEVSWINLFIIIYILIAINRSRWILKQNNLQLSYCVADASITIDLVHNISTGLFFQDIFYLPASAACWA